MSVVDSPRPSQERSNSYRFNQTPQSSNYVDNSAEMRTQLHARRIYDRNIALQNQIPAVMLGGSGTLSNMNQLELMEKAVKMNFPEKRTVNNHPSSTIRTLQPQLPCRCAVDQSSEYDPPAMRAASVKRFPRNHNINRFNESKSLTSSIGFKEHRASTLFHAPLRNRAPSVPTPDKSLAKVSGVSIK